MTLMFPKSPPLRDRKYLDAVREMPCIITGTYSSEWQSVVPAHLDIGGDGGTSMKNSDNRVFPLLAHLHDEQHRVGHLRWWREAVTMNDQLLTEALIALAEKRYREWKNDL